jgi:hypothetical protein
MSEGISIGGVSVNVGSESRNISSGASSGARPQQLDSGDILNQLRQSLQAQQKQQNISFEQLSHQNEFNFMFARASSVSNSDFFKKAMKGLEKEKPLLYDQMSPPGEMGKDTKTVVLNSLQFEAKNALLKWKSQRNLDMNFGKFFIESEITSKE